jgi:hypothetical protein
MLHSLKIPLTVILLEEVFNALIGKLYIHLKIEIKQQKKIIPVESWKITKMLRKRKMVESVKT